MSKIVIVGDTTEDLAEYALKYSATFVDLANITQATGSDGNYYVSLGDVTIPTLVTLLRSADKIILQAKLNWSNSELYYYTLIICQNVNVMVPVENLKFHQEHISIPLFSTPTPRPTDEPCLWLYGGSLVTGSGLEDPVNDRYDSKLASLLNINTVINLAKNGSGLRCSLETLVTSDIKPNDYVILDTTTLGRIRINEQGIIKDQFLSDCSRELVVATTADQLLYDQLSYLDLFVKLCELLQARFVFYSGQPKDELFFPCILHYSKYKQYCLRDEFIDFGTDSEKPGVKSHEQLAKNLYQRLVELYDVK